MSTTSKNPENHPSPESPEPTQQELALAWYDRELAKARKANAPYEAAGKILETPAAKPVDVPDPGPDSGADREDWKVEKYADSYEREQAEYLLYDDDPARDAAWQRLDDLAHEREQIVDYVNGEDYLDDQDVKHIEANIREYAAKEIEYRISGPESDFAAG